MSNVTKLKTATLPSKSIKPVAPKVSAKELAKAERNRRYATYGIAGVALTLTALSLTHLTCGIALVTGGSTIESAAMAVGIDAGFVALEVSQIINLPAEVTKEIKKFAQPAIIGTMLASAALNAFGFAAHASGAMVYPAVALGCAIPALIYCLTRVAVRLAK